MNAVTTTFRRVSKPGRAASKENTYEEVKHPKDCECSWCMERKPYQLRLPSADIDHIRWAFSELEGLVGLGSNFGHMCERIKQSQPPKPPKAQKPEPHERGEIRLALADRRIGTSKKLPRQGVPLPTMHVRGTTYELRAYCSPLDAWCGPNIKGRSPKSLSVHVAWLALSAMVRQGLTARVVTLFRMYGQDTSRLLTARFPDMGDLVALAEDTDIIAAHVVRMTKRLHAESRSKTFFVTPREAMVDLLEKRTGCIESVRASAVVTCRLQAHKMLVQASNSYRAAKGAL